MTNHVVRLYTAAAGIFVLFLTWAVIAAHPWPSKPAQDPRLIALAVHQQAYRQEAALVKTLLAKQRAVAAAARVAPVTQVASVPTAQPASVRVVTLPPLTITRVS